MNIFSRLRRLWSARQLPASAAASHAKADVTARMLQNLQQLCATLPLGEAEVWLCAGQIQVSLNWNPEDDSLRTPQDSQLVARQEKTWEKSGLYFRLNGVNEEVQYAEYGEACSKEPVPSTPLHADREGEKSEKPGRQLKALRQLLSYLQLHYAFRYNRLTDRTECAFLSGSGERKHELHYQPADSRVLNSISLQVLQAGIPCWDRDIRRYAESAEIPSYHPFTYYMEHLPVWDGVDRISPLARRVSGDDIWVKSFHRWMLGITASWIEWGNPSQRANSVAPVLVSTRQGLGKSTFCRMLLPACLQDYFTESFDLTNPSSAENKLASFGLINLDEFDRLPASRMPQLKNLMQMERLNIRRAYKHSGEPLPRIASFIGTSNRRDLLTDRSGSRRFICVEVEHPIDCTTPLEYAQIYAQLKHELQHGERSWFSKEEEAEIQQANEAFYRVTPAEELLQGTFEFCDAREEGAHLLSAAQIYISLKSKNPAALHDCTPLAFSKLLAQMGRRVHTKNGNGYWVKSVLHF